MTKKLVIEANRDALITGSAVPSVLCSTLPVAKEAVLEITRLFTHEYLQTL